MKGFSHCCCYLSVATVAGLYYLILPDRDRRERDGGVAGDGLLLCCSLPSFSLDSKGIDLSGDVVDERPEGVEWVLARPTRSLTNISPPPICSVDDFENS